MIKKSFLIMVERKSFDLAVIGSGPGGYVAAIKGAQLGMSVALIEKEMLGGTCLNIGCIPVKTLLSNAHILRKIQEANAYGIDVGNISFNFAKMNQRKNSTILILRKNLEGLIKKNGVSIFRGNAKFISTKELKIKGEDNLFIKADKVIIATGSEELPLQNIPFDYKKIHTSTSILDLIHLPKSLTIIGGGYIGSEFTSLFSILGVKITLIEATPTLLPGQEKDIVEVLTKNLRNRGVDIYTNTTVKKIDKKPDKISLLLSNGNSISTEMVLVTIGRKPRTTNLDIDKAQVKVNKSGFIVVNEKMETNVPSTYAIGDVVGPWMLAHVASHQAIVAAKNGAGDTSSMNYLAIPSAIFTYPQIASVGLTSKKAQDLGYSINIGKFPFSALGAAIVSMEVEGFVKIISDKKTKAVLGAHIVGNGAATMIGEMTLATNNELTLPCIYDTVHAHPTFPEAWMEGALVADETPLHLPKL